jgi:ATP/maltotriose-dependent transcriptional regulator MalT
MGRKKLPPEKGLTKHLKTRVNAAKFQQLQAQLRASGHKNMAALLRHILKTTPIKTAVYDHTLDTLMEELASIRGEIKSIQINMGQVETVFERYPTVKKTDLWVLYKQSRLIRQKEDKLLGLISKLAHVWLSK